MQRALLALFLFAAACTSGTAPGPATTALPPITTTSSTLPTGPGLCGTPLLTDERIPDVQAADELISRFITDRSHGLGAEGCLTDAAAQAFANSSFPLCLYKCSDIAQLELPKTLNIAPAGETSLGPLRSLLIDYQIEDRIHRRIRETYDIQTVRGPGDRRQVMIADVTIEPESMVTEIDARRILDDLLAALADGAWDVAGTLLVDQGTTAAIEARFPDLWTTPWNELLEPFCETALCGASYEILGSEILNAQSRTFDVQFDATEGPVVVEIPVVAFENSLTAGDLPPEGIPERPLISVQDQLFPDGLPSRFALVRSRALQFGEPDSGWYAWPSALNAPDMQTVAGWVLFTGFGGVRLATYESGTVEVQKIIAADPWRLAGVAMIDDAPTALLTDGRRLVAYALGTDEVRTLVDLDGSESSIACATIGGDQVLVTSTVGDSTSYDLYGLADLVQLAHLEPKKASGCAILSPDGSTFAYTADVSLNNPQTIVLTSSLDGTEIDRWSVLADAVIASQAFTTSLAFDGRYAAAALSVPPRYAPYAESEDLGRRFIVDTQTGDQWMVTTGVHVLFPPG
ncbi:hypothetical protein BMS3Abin02_01937 [bacterium BMS3Abin02]|nr:hypothetical protein BMS3Abin02_01937 [bacterium BMS3Abin02]GBE22388.1 hypothetical protein BMS3Bbin01_01762 [bacterium BMS3Bbin01]HDH26780.1 hypothetical protein [Actinomycetota bacterium]